MTLRDCDDRHLREGDFVRPTAVGSLPDPIQHAYGRVLGRVVTLLDTQARVEVRWDGTATSVLLPSAEVQKVGLQPYMLAELVRTADSPRKEFAQLDRVDQEITLCRLQRERRRHLILLACSLLALAFGIACWFVTPNEIDDGLGKLIAFTYGMVGAYVGYRFIARHRVIRQLDAGGAR